jgi:hypothetical protein
VAEPSHGGCRFVVVGVVGERADEVVDCECAVEGESVGRRVSGEGRWRGGEVRKKRKRRLGGGDGLPLDDYVNEPFSGDLAFVVVSRRR